MAQRKSDCLLGETQLTEYQPSCPGSTVSLHRQEERWAPLPSPYLSLALPHQPRCCWLEWCYLYWILHSRWRLQRWGRWWEEGIWWVDKLKRQKQASRSKNIILGAHGHLSVYCFMFSLLICSHSRYQWVFICTKGKVSQALFLLICSHPFCLLLIRKSGTIYPHKHKGERT